MNRWLPILTALLLCVPAGLAADAGGYVDDQALLAALTRQVQQLYDAHQLAPIKLLREQLARRTVTLPLAVAPRQALAPADLYRRAEASVLVHCHLYHCDKCQRMHVNASTCFPLTADGVCVANYHAFQTSNTLAMAVATRAGQVYPVTEVLAASERDDVVLFRTAAAHLTPLALAAAAVGDPVAVISHPRNLFYVMTQGHVARYCLERGAQRLQITADYAVGSSGGPVLDACGAVVGLVAKTQDLYSAPHDGQHDNLQMVVKLCVPSASIRKLIKEEQP